jgi:hypothetical protein
MVCAPAHAADFNTMLNRMNHATQNANQIMNNVRGITNPNGGGSAYGPNGHAYYPPSGAYPPPQGYGGYGAPQGNHSAPQGYGGNSAYQNYNTPRQVYSAPQAKCEDAQGNWYFEYSPGTWVRSQVQYIPPNKPENVVYPSTGPCASQPHERVARGKTRR